MSEDSTPYMKSRWDKRITLAITGASGAPYALRLLEQLIAADFQVFVLISSAACMGGGSRSTSFVKHLRNMLPLLSEHVKPVRINE